MPTAINISDDLVTQARSSSEIFRRTVAGQIEYWARIGRLAEENPDIPFPFILDILKGKEQIKAGLGTPYIFGEGE